MAKGGSDSAMIALRPYQLAAIEAIKTHYARGCHRQLLSLPTGSGKTLIFASLLAELNRPALVIAHTDELLRQTYDKISMLAPGAPLTIVNGACKATAKFTIGSIQSCCREPTLSMLAAQNFEVCVVDEAHHVASDSYRHVLHELGFGTSTQKLLIGLTATPERGDKKGLRPIFDEVVYQRTIGEMIAEGYLVRPRGVRITAENIDFAAIKASSSGAERDFAPSALAAVLDTDKMSVAVVKAWQAHASDRPTIAFGINVAHAYRLAAAFESAGVTSGVVHGALPDEQRRELLEQYRDGKIQVLCNCQVLTEGFDAPATSCIVIGRPTMSPGLYTQMVGRGLRLWPNKVDCIVLDCGDRSHSICSVASLLDDAEVVAARAKEEQQEKVDLKKPILSLPPVLQTILREFDLLLGEQPFAWKRAGDSHYLQGVSGLRLVIAPAGNTYAVTLEEPESDPQVICRDLDFEYSFSTAQAFVVQNRQLFVLSDLEAPWRQDAISDKQAAFLASCGYESPAISSLSKGQAAALIGSGRLKKHRNVNAATGSPETAFADTLKTH
jgi:ATP-dependent helicase IRC3